MKAGKKTHMWWSIIANPYAVSLLIFLLVVFGLILLPQTRSLFNSKITVQKTNAEPPSSLVPTDSIRVAVEGTRDQEEQPSATMTPSPSNSSSIATIKTSTPTATPKPTQKPTTSPTSKPTATPTPTPIPTIDYSKPWTVATNCPATTQRCVPCTSGSDCRYEPNKTHGFRGWACQNNNPGNIRNASTNMSSDFKNKLIEKYGGTAACGVRYDSRGGSYFVFSSYSAGYEGLKAYIKAINNGEHSSYQGTGWKCGNCTITQFFSKYAPGDSSYDDLVAASIDEPVTQTLSYIVANKLARFVDAIKTREGFFVQ